MLRLLIPAAARRRSRRRESTAEGAARVLGFQELLDDVERQDLPPRWHDLVVFFLRTEHSQWFSGTILCVIVAAGILAGISSYDSFSTGTKGDVISQLDQIVLYIFVFEIIIKLGATGRRPWIYFNDNWNVFDFSIVVLSFLPLDFDFAILRTIRLLRVLKLLNALPKLRILVLSLLNSTKSIGYVVALLGLVFYLYSVMACFLFKKNDQFHFRDLHNSLLSMYRASTFEDWTDIMYINMYGCNKHFYSVDGTRLDGSPLPDWMLCHHPATMQVGAALFFCSFTLVTSMVLFKLFIGVILTQIEKSQEEFEREKKHNKAAVNNTSMFVENMRQSLEESKEHTGAQLRWSKVRRHVVNGTWRQFFLQELEEKKAELEQIRHEHVNYDDVVALLSELRRSLDSVMAVAARVQKQQTRLNENLKASIPHKDRVDTVPAMPDERVDVVEEKLL